VEFFNLKKCMDNLLYGYKTPGIDCLVYRDHKPIFRYYVGTSDRENGIQMNGQEQYYIFSMTKMLTCVCALQLWEKGAFSLDDPVSDYLPEYSNMKICDGRIAQNHITVRNLFSMTAGLDYNINASYVREAIADGKVTTLELVREFSHTPLGFEPGTRFRYSLCHDVLGGLVEVWSGKKLGDYMRENLLNPLEMNNTFFGAPDYDEVLSEMTVLYTWEEPDCEPNSQLPARMPLHCRFILTDEYQSGGAGLVSCTKDYALFLDALANGGVAFNGNSILKSATVELMQTNQLAGKALEDFYGLRKGYGYGMGVRTHIDSSVSGSLSPIGEFGWDGAAGAFSIVDTANKLSLTYFQSVLGWDLKIQEEIRNALYKDINAHESRD